MSRTLKGFIRATTVFQRFNKWHEFFWEANPFHLSRPAVVFLPFPKFRSKIFSQIQKSTSTAPDLPISPSLIPSFPTFLYFSKINREMATSWAPKPTLLKRLIFEPLVSEMFSGRLEDQLGDLPSFIWESESSIRVPSSLEKDGEIEALMRSPASRADVGDRKWRERHQAHFA